MKVYIAPGAFHNHVRSMFTRQGYQPVPLKDSPEALVLIGGPDINPKRYGELPLSSTYYDDRIDDLNFSLAQEFWSLPKIGICLGGQVLNVINGGSMWQDVNNHNQTHSGVDTKTGRLVILSSIHHQQMIPEASGLILTTSQVSTTKKSQKRLYEAPEGSNRYLEDIEAVYYEKSRSLCFQGHPEIGPGECEQYFFSLIHDNMGI